MHKNSVTILGSGTSTGVPTTSCHCPICQEALHNPQSKNNRLRSSILLSTKRGKNILIDTTPDLRAQILQNGIEKVDFALITHDHADHLHGIDDLRPFCFFQEKKVIPILATKYTQQRLIQRFDYIFNNTQEIIGGGIPHLELQNIQADLSEHDIDGEPFYFFSLPHGHISTVGFYHQGLAYLTDCVDIPDKVIQFLQKKDVEILIIDCTRRKPHATHLHLDKSLEYIKQIAPNNARLIHLSHDFDHDSLNQELRERGFDQTQVAYDGEIITY